MTSTEELASALKDLPLRIQTGSLVERKKIFDHVKSVLLHHPAVTEQVIRGMCKVIQMAVTRYRDATSQSLIASVITALSTAHPDWMLKHLTVAINDIAVFNSSLVSTKSTAQECIHALTWSSILVKTALPKASEPTDESFEAIVTAQSILLTSILSASHTRKTAKAHHILIGLWNSDPNELIPRYQKAIMKLPGSTDTVVFGSFFFRHLQVSKKDSFVGDLKKRLVEDFVKTVIGSKTRARKQVIEACRHFLISISHSDFADSLLPPIQKAMLRNPELTIHLVPHVLSGLSIDLSQYAPTIASSITSSLCCNDDEVRQLAVDSFKSLASQCSDSQAVTDVALLLFQLFGGSQGKITVADHKISILQAIGNLSNNAVTGASVQTLSESVAQQFIKVLQIEVHEKTLTHCVEMLSRWCTKFTTDFPSSLIQWFDKAPSLKTSTSPVRVAYLSAMIASCSSASVSHFAPMITTLLSYVDKAVAQPTQMGSVTEGLGAAVLLLKISSFDSSFDSKLAPLFALLADAGMLVFTSDKFLTQASPDALCQFVWLADKLLAERGNELKNPIPLYRGLVLSLTRGRSVLVRIRPSLQRLFSSLQGTPVVIAIFEQLTEIILSVKTQCNGDSSSGKDAENVVDSIKPGHIVQAVTTLSSGSNLTPEDKKSIAFHSILVCHHPLVESIQSRLWLKLIKYFKLDAPKFVKQYHGKLVNLLIVEYKCHPTYGNALKTVIRIDPSTVLPSLLNRVKTTLNDPQLLNVTQTECDIFLSPPNELFDKSIITKDSDSSLNMKNVKRESKVYSYKEQQEEIALRKELEEKKRKEGKITQPELTSKQKELVRIQMEKETAIRRKLSSLHEKLEATVKILETAASADPFSTACKLSEIIPVLVRCLSSPLAVYPLSSTYLKLRLVAFIRLTSASPLTTLRISEISLKLVKPAGSVQLSQSQQMKEEMRWAIGEIDRLRDELTAPGLTYLLPMMEVAVGGVTQTDPIISTVIRILTALAKLRATGSADLHDPSLLPRRQFISLLIDVIARTTGRVQQQSSSCLQELAEASSGGPGCAAASEPEIDLLLTALQHSSQHVRDAALRALLALVPVFPTVKENPEQYLRITRRIWVTKFDLVDEIREMADRVWQKAGLSETVSGLSEDLLSDVIHPVIDVQEAAARALTELLSKSSPNQISSVLQLLLDTYNEKNNMIPPKVDSLGRIVERPVDTWEPRSGVALALSHLAPLLPSSDIVPLAKFFVEKGLGDRSDAVRNNMLAAALATLDHHGKESVSKLLPVLEPVLESGPDCGSYDSVRQSVVILMGSLARHLDKDDPKVKPIVEKLVDALATPSQQVQEAVANCLPALTPSIKDEAPALVQRLLDQLLSSESYGQRKGAAYGLAGLVKGMGILVLKQLDIMTTLTTAIQNKYNYRHREGALFAFEMLCTVLGRLFEPYIVHVLPHLLLCFGDGTQYVRDATNDCAKVVMSKLSAHGVKLVLPSLLAALEKDSWRTKTGSVELLGAMAFCAPKQLSSCLPSIVPKLIEVLSDSHIKVQTAGTEALKQIGSVIRNPEIQAIVPVLLEALQDPSQKTATCLQTLLDTQFVHFIDAPSLALIMPVVQRAFMDRSTETRKMAAQIIGNMYSLTDQKDLTPYLPTIIPGLKASLLDPVPEVRSVSARALGAMVRGMGESSFEDLLPWLMKTLTSEVSSVDRSGAAQGLSEVVGGLGVDKLHKLMPEIISTAERSDIAPHVKDGYIMMFIYMPVVFTNEFTPYIGEIIIPILKALADENEYVRDTALKAGQRIVNLYADSAITLLLPELEKGLFDDNWRIRYSSVQLLGDLLYRISGVSGKMSTETANEDDNFGTEQSHSAIIGALGGERRNRVLSGLYMGRSDVALMVRQAALHVWKVVVTNTPRTLREILPTLFSLLLSCLASTSHDKRQVAAKTLGDLVRKLGERVLPEIIPILEKGLESEEADQRQGVCIGLSEMMASTSRDMVLTFVNSLVPTVRKALCDPLPEVRQAAAKTFDSLHSTVGVRALDDILPQMLQQLNKEDEQRAEWALDGLRQVMTIKSRVVLPYLVPQLTSPPVNTKALSILASVAGDALSKYLVKILPALLSALALSDNSPQELEYCQAVILSVADEGGICTTVDQLIEASRSDSVETRRAAATLLCAFTTHTRADYSQHVPQLIRGLILSFVDKDPLVLQMSWDALSSVTKSLDSSQQIQYVGDVRQAIKFASSDIKTDEFLLPGLCLQKGITPILPIFREAILNGAPEIKESAAMGLGEAILLSTAESLQPSVIHITGPLIRILGDRFPPSVKAAVLQTLATLLAKVGMMLKQFLPQLQTTFLKALNDASRLVRLKAAFALSHLILIHSRPDPLFQELHSLVKSADEPSVRETMIQALRGVVTGAGDKISDPVIKGLHTSLLSLLSHQDEGTRTGGAGCLGALLKWLPSQLLNSTLEDHLLVDDPSLDWTLRHGRSTALFVALKETPSRIYTTDKKEAIHKVLLGHLLADRVAIVMNGVRGCTFLFDHLMTVEEQIPAKLLSPFVRVMNQNWAESKQLVARSCLYLARREIRSVEFLKSVIPMLVNGTKEKNSYVKSNSELALVAVLHLRSGDDKLQKCLQLLEEGAREALQDVISRALRKVSPPDGRPEDLDDTLLT